MNEERKIQSEPSYWVVIPADVRYDKQLKDKAKFLYGEISALCNKDGYCYATNKYFADLYNVKKETISRLLTQLKQRGYIEVKIELDEQTHQVKRRLIYLLTKKSIPIDNSLHGGIDKKVKENNTSINNTINILVDFFNDLNVYPKVSKVTETRKKKVKSRLNDVGYDNLIKAMQEGTKSEFLTGKSKNSNWKADFDWFIENDTNAIKVLEGKYSNNQEEQKEESRMYGPILN